MESIFKQNKQKNQKKPKGHRPYPLSHLHLEIPQASKNNDVINFFKKNNCNLLNLVNVGF
jgi:hypothetical protein